MLEKGIRKEINCPSATFILVMVTNTCHVSRFDTPFLFLSDTELAGIEVLVAWSVITLVLVIRGIVKLDSKYVKLIINYFC